MTKAALFEQAADKLADTIRYISARLTEFENDPHALLDVAMSDKEMK